MITWDETKRRENLRLRAVMTPHTSSPAAMPIARKSKSTSQPFSAAEIAAAKAAAKTSSNVASANWSKGTVTRGGGVAATIEAIRRTRGPNKNPTKEQVAIRFDREVLAAFRAGGPGWQTRMNAALKEWLAAQPRKRKAGRARSGG